VWVVGSELAVRAISRWIYVDIKKNFTSSWCCLRQKFYEEWDLLHCRISISCISRCTYCMKWCWWLTLAECNKMAMVDVDDSCQSLATGLRVHSGLALFCVNQMNIAMTFMMTALRYNHHLSIVINITNSIITLKDLWVCDLCCCVVSYASQNTLTS